MAAKCPRDTAFLSLFDGHLDLLPLYDQVEDAVLNACPNAEIEVKKTQISFFARCMFACVSLQRVFPRRICALPYLTLTLSLPHSVSADRPCVQCQTGPGRWTVHFPLTGPEDLDPFLISLLAEAYAFGCSRRGSRG